MGVGGGRAESDQGLLQERHLYIATQEVTGVIQEVTGVSPPYWIQAQDTTYCM